MGSELNKGDPQINSAVGAAILAIEMATSCGSQEENEGE
jgi:hypothetical protein